MNSLSFVPIPQFIRLEKEKNKMAKEQCVCGEVHPLICGFCHQEMDGYHDPKHTFNYQQSGKVACLQSEEKENA